MNKDDGEIRETRDDKENRVQEERLADMDEMDTRVRLAFEERPVPKVRLEI